MAFGFFFNMEKLSLIIAENHINNMTNNNYEDDVFLDSKNLLINLENGFVALTQLNCYFESFLNTIINSCMNYDGEIILKCSIEEKLEIIFMHYEKTYEGYVSLCHEIAQVLGLKIFDKVDVFECDGRDGLTNYVFDAKYTNVDESRFEENQIF